MQRNIAGPKIKMGASKLKESRKQRFLRENCTCCFCGGGTEATTWDHVPPKACFPQGHFPENFEFPACEECNQATRKHDQVFGFYASLIDAFEENYRGGHLRKLHQGIANNYPEMLPNLKLSASFKRRYLRKLGLRRPSEMLLSEVPLVAVPSEFKKSANVIARKLVCAINYKERSLILPKGTKINSGFTQTQNPLAKDLIDYIDRNLPVYRQPIRPNIRSYGRRLAYKFGSLEKEEFTMLGAQFGNGLFLWAISSSPPVKINGPIQSSSEWFVGSDWVD